MNKLQLLAIEHRHSAALRAAQLATCSACSRSFVGPDGEMVCRPTARTVHSLSLTHRRPNGECGPEAAYWIPTTTIDGAAS